MPKIEHLPDKRAIVFHFPFLIYTVDSILQINYTES